MSRLSEQLAEMPPRRDPPYRPLAGLTPQEREWLADRIGDPANYDLPTLRALIQADPGNLEFRKAMLSAIASAEFAGIDAFSRKVPQWQEWPVPWSLIMAMARQTWDEVRHAWFAKECLESYGGTLGEYPDTLAGGGVQRNAEGQPVQVDPVVSLSTTNVALEGAGLIQFRETHELGVRIGDRMMAHCYDYNWADEVTHTAIGDYFVKLLCQDNPEAERRALVAHAQFEAQRARLTGEQMEELKEFFAEEMERASSALGTAQEAERRGGTHHG